MNTENILKGLFDTFASASWGKTVSISPEALDALNVLDPFIFAKAEALLHLVESIAQQHKDSVRSGEPWCDTCNTLWPCLTQQSIINSLYIIPR